MFNDYPIHSTRLTSKLPPEQGYGRVPDPSLARIHSTLQTTTTELFPLHAIASFVESGP